MTPTQHGVSGPLALFLAVALLLPLGLGGCASFFFYPSKERYGNPELEKAAPEDVWCESAGGIRLHGLRLHPVTSPPRGTIVFFHGNAENVRTHINAVLWLVGEGYQVVAFDYRGYGMSAGTPDIAGVNEDGLAILDAAFRMEGVDRERVAVLGQSLGGAVAVYAVARSPWKPRVRAVVADSAFAGYRRIVRDKLKEPIVTWPLAYPASWTVDDGRSPERWIGTLSPVPVVVIHGTKDPVVPYSHGELLYRLANDPKGFWAVEGGGHTDALFLPDVRKQLVDFLDSVLPPRGENISPPRIDRGPGNG
jgi:pimeloyl-ACP methyl ester carboxylesterase